MTTDKILTKAIAEEIFRTNFEEAELSQFTAIEEDAAWVLPFYEGGYLNFAGLEQISESVADVLSNYKGNLNL